MIVVMIVAIVVAAAISAAILNYFVGKVGIAGASYGRSLLVLVLTWVLSFVVNFVIGLVFVGGAEFLGGIVCPNVVTLGNGIIVCTYSRPGNWLIFSDDNGRTWKGALQFGTGNAYNYILEVASDTIQVYHETREGNEEMVRGAFFTVRKTH